MILTFNGTRKIEDAAGDYIVLTDYGTEGLAVSHQAATLREAVEFQAASSRGPSAIVRLVRLKSVEVP